MNFRHLALPARAVARTTLVLAALLAPLWGCAGTPDEQALAEVPPADELYAEGVAILETPKNFWRFDLTPYEKAVDRFQEVIDNYPYSDYAVLAELRIADVYFEQKRWDEALSYYLEFAELHPDHEKVPYTIYRAALSHYNQSEDPIRDQTSTREALNTLDALITHYPRAPEVREAEALWRELRTKLARQELLVGDFYLARNEYQSAAGRYRDVLNDYPGLGLDAEALYKLGVCYTHMNRGQEARHLFEVILRNYRESTVASVAEGQIPNISATN